MNVLEMRQKLEKYAREEMGAKPDTFAGLDAMIDEAAAQAGFDYEEPLRGISGFRLFWRKGMRRRIAWFVVPLFEQQRIKNERNARILRKMADILKQTEQETKRPER